MAEHQACLNVMPRCCLSYAKIYNKSDNNNVWRGNIMKVIMGNESDSFLLNPLSSPTSLNDSTAVLRTWVVAILCIQGDASNGCATNGGI